MKTVLRSFRLPAPVVASLKEAAKLADVSMTEILVRVLARAIEEGELPRPVRESDVRRLDFLQGR